MWSKIGVARVVVKFVHCFPCVVVAADFILPIFTSSLNCATYSISSRLASGLANAILSAIDAENRNHSCGTQLIRSMPTPSWQQTVSHCAVPNPVRARCAHQTRSPAHLMFWWLRKTDYFLPHLSRTRCAACSFSPGRYKCYYYERSLPLPFSCKERGTSIILRSYSAGATIANCRPRQSIILRTINTQLLNLARDGVATDAQAHCRIILPTMRML